MGRRIRIDPRFREMPGEAHPSLGPGAEVGGTPPIVGWMPPVFEDAETYGLASARQAVDACRAARREPVGVTPLVFAPADLPVRVIKAMQRGVEEAWVARGVPVEVAVVQPGPLRLGFAVQARARRRRTARGARPGDALRVSRALGDDVLVQAFAEGMRTAAQTRAWVRTATTVDPGLGRELAAAGPVRLLGPDGLAGAALEIAEAWDLDVVLNAARLPVAAGVTGHLLAGIRPPSLERNRRAAGARVSVARGVSEAAAQLVFGAEWTGGALWVDDAGGAAPLGVLRRRRGRRPIVRMLAELDVGRSSP